MRATEIAALFELGTGVKSGRAGAGAQDAVLLAVFAAEILDDGFEDAGVIVDGENDWFSHRKRLSSLNYKAGGISGEVEGKLLLRDRGGARTKKGLGGYDTKRREGRKRDPIRVTTVTGPPRTEGYFSPG